MSPRVRALRARSRASRAPPIQDLPKTHKRNKRSKKTHSRVAVTYLLTYLLTSICKWVCYDCFATVYVKQMFHFGINSGSQTLWTNCMNPIWINKCWGQIGLVDACHRASARFARGRALRALPRSRISQKHIWIKRSSRYLRPYVNAFVTISAGV